MQLWSDDGAWKTPVAPYEPFPWQSRLVREVAARGRWPDLLDLPTGSGKTTAIDVAVFHLALEADRGADRRAAMRIAFVVDRRLVVDDAYARAKRLAEALADAVKPETAAPAIIRRVAERLESLAGPGQPPLAAAKLRGGAPLENDWARTPSQPTVLCSTVDQVGSRLLFRGYGVNDRAKSIHAGLLGSDALVLLDEAHLSQPFRQTVQAIAAEPSLKGSDPRPLSVALLTATPGEEAADAWRFGLGDDDRATPILARRLDAPKPAMLVEIAEKERDGQLIEEALKLLSALQANGVSAPVIGVVVNRIARARAVFTALRAREDGSDVALVIGRARAVDRDGVAKRLDPIRTGADRPVKALIVVATQTIEAGVDIDLDGLVTDAASLDALRQRFGRVNRAGRAIAARAVVVAAKSDRKPGKEGDPVYGEAIARTLEALFPAGDETIDFGPAAMEQWLKDHEFEGSAVAPLLADKADAPVLMPAYVDLWTHTSPVPAADPDTALFLHGPRRAPAAVQVVWRADVRALIEAPDDARLRELLTLAPPRSAETLELPVHAARLWLRGEKPDLADVDSRPLDDEAKGVGRSAFRWRGPDDDRSTVVAPGDIRPGDLIVVPSEYGGCDEYGWNPGSRAWTPDVAAQAAAPYAGRRFALRLAPGLIRQALEAEPAPESETAVDRERRLTEETERAWAPCEAALADLRGGASIPEVCDALAPLDLRGLGEPLLRLRKHGRFGRGDRPVFAYGDDNGQPERGVVLAVSRGLGSAPSEGAIVSTEDDRAASFVGRPLPLWDHSKQVEALVRRFARDSGVPAEVAADLACAGWLHDAGKADPRFQRLLAGGDPFAMEKAAEAGGASVLAKSAEGRSRNGAWERAGLPDGWRHEALSVRLALLNPRLQEAHDRALVLWLIGSHHGLGRPFFGFRDPLDEAPAEGETAPPPRLLAAVEGLVPAQVERGDGPQRLSFVLRDESDFAPRDWISPWGEEQDDDLRGLDWFTLFRDLKRRYGPWGLAKLEATLRLADHRASEAAAREPAEASRAGETENAA